VAIILGIGWQHYAYAGLALSVPSPNQNLLPSGNFDHYDANGIPSGWRVHKSGDVAYEVNRDKGYVGGSSFKLSVTRYKEGDVTLTSPKMMVQSHKNYLFKGYYLADTQSVLLARYYYRDGTNRLTFVQTYPSNTTTWSTMSDAFASLDNIVAVQFVYRLASVGYLRIDGVYMEPKQNVYIAPTTAVAPNTIPNSGLIAANDINMPDGWKAYRSGANTAAFSYDHNTTGAYVSVKVTDYKSGEAKWQYAPQSVIAHQYYQFGVNYQSDAPAELVAEYVFQDGHRQFETLAPLMPVDEWTNITHSFEVPVGAANMFVSVVLQHTGTIATQDYTLVNTTKPGATHWSRPLVSITFDDGWQSAYADAAPVLARYGYKATFYINPSSIETPNFMSAAELTLLSKAGNEIAAHGYAHDDMTAINANELDYQLHQGRDYLRTAGFLVTDFATPYGNSDAEVQWYARNYFMTLRSTETGINTRQHFDPYNLKVLYINKSTSKEVLAAALHNTKLSDGWLILVYHSVGTVSSPIKSLKVENAAITTPAFAEQIDLTKKSGITVQPVGAAYAEIQNQ
jgi:peptidoglycan/xylan/chitin deacetylase (PgdA/CDA1 family)